MHRGGVGLAAICGVGLWIHDKCISTRLLEELPELKAMHNDAVTLAATTSDDGYFSVRHSEKRIFQLVCSEVEWNINQREQFFTNGIPIVRSLLPPSKLEDIMAYVLWKIAVDDDGDFYDSYLDFYARYSPNSLGTKE